jgi:hypothetical protein
MMDQFLYSLYTVLFVVLAAWTALLWRRSRSVGTLMALLVMLAMIYENGVLVLGVVIGHGPLLETLSWGRFIGYAVFPPLLVIGAVELARRVGVAWADRRAVRIGAWVAAFALAAFALFVEVLGRELEPRVLNDVVRSMWVSKGVPPLGVILMNMLLIVCGVAIWRKTRNAILMVGALFLLVGDGLAAGRYVFGSGIELAFMAFVAAAEAWALGLRSRPASEPQIARHAVGD